MGFLTRRQTVQARLSAALEPRFGIDMRSLAAFRVALGLVLVLDLLGRARNLELFYTDAGAFPVAVLREQYPALSRLSVHALSGGIGLQALLFASAIGFALALIVGYRTRIATLASLYLLLSLHIRNPHVLMGGDALLQHLLFWSLFLPLGARWSVDARRRDASHERAFGVASAALLVQVCLVYGVNAVLKLRTDAWLAGFAPVLGVYGVSLMLAFMGGALAWVWLARSGKAAAAVALAAALFPAGWAAGQVAWTQTEGPVREAALLQGNFGQDIKWDRAWLEPQLEWYAARTREHLDADIVLWPETALPAFYHQLRVPYFSTLAEAGREAGTSILAGTLYGEGDDVFNAIVGLGAAEGVYRKIHLVPLGEFFPFKPLVRFLMPGLDIPMSDMTAGKREQPALTVGGREVAPIICYEDAFGELTRRLLPEAGLLVSVSNDGWFGDSFAAHQHLQIARVRAQETGRPMLRATNTGISALIDHQGRVEQTLSQFEQGVLRGGVQMRTGATPFVQFGYAPVLLLCVLAVLAAAVSTRGLRID
jgi:apolipoprotein N-acyltransferase